MKKYQAITSFFFCLSFFDFSDLQIFTRLIFFSNLIIVSLLALHSARTTLKCYSRLFMQKDDAEQNAIGIGGLRGGELG